MMQITYTEEKIFTQQQVQDLFLSVGWVSGKYPSRLYKALMHSSTVITAWDGDALVGLARLLDDSELVAYMHYVLVHPTYHGHGIASEMVKRVKEKYLDYLYIENHTRGKQKRGLLSKTWFYRHVRWCAHAAM